MKAKIFSIAALVLAAFSANAALVPVTLSGSTVWGSDYGNTFTYTEGGVTVTASAWSLTSAGGTFQSSQLNRFDTGLGVCDRSEGKRCDSPQHQVDNVGSYNFVLFQFSALVDPLTVVINPVNNNPDYDRDVSYWTGISAESLYGKTVAQLSAMGFGDRKDANASADDDALTVSLVSPLANSLLFGASMFDSHDRDDWFKITSIKFDYTAPPPVQVPEPGSLALIALALGGLGLARRRRAA